ncbi:YafY family transcriptional regulator [Xanthobacter autotrophicus]|uniref:helix-turn-helix transcriptional regulator n=1 Tax=Xanthobacter autotrophicus TaxID=280 RepID=UPI001E557677|nr:YafY family protein [Xanthobacter autotrophicus]UDQ91513.1 YafY family transcriptional regulator [Xanthobacter autotrophicus]
MRASRLLSILMVLQARGAVTAQALAEECEVSLRTIYRDIDALSAAGVPVYAERGAGGGYRLLEGYRTRLNGLSAQEAQALFLSGLGDAATALGLGAVLAAAQTKVTAGLPANLRSAAARMRARFHLDAPGWFYEAEEPPFLQAVAAAAWEQHLIEIRYQSWRAEKRRRVAPLGLVLKSGAWYLVGSVEGSVRTYRIGRIRELEPLAERFEPPVGFDLAAWWGESTRRLEAEMYPNRATVRLSPLGLRMLEHVTPSFSRAGMVVGDSDAEGCRIVTLRVGSLWEASSELMRFGAEAEVLEPPELRARVMQTLEQMRQRYTP